MMFGIILVGGTIFAGRDMSARENFFPQKEGRRG